MRNFDFVRAALPSVHADCTRAESYLPSDPRSACFYSRGAVEKLVAYLYDVLRLTYPYFNDVVARTNDPALFRVGCGGAVVARLNSGRKLGTLAAQGRGSRQTRAYRSEL